MIDILMNAAPTAKDAVQGLGFGSSTLSAIAATVAALVAAAVGGIQLYVGRRQSQAALLSAQAAMKTAESTGRRRTAEFRQAWINTVTETVTEYHSLLLISKWRTGGPTPEERIRRGALHTKLEVLLNPNEDATVALLAALDGVRSAGDYDTGVELSPKVVAAARTILKAEWKRIKRELE